MIEPRNTPCSQSRASCTSGTTVERRPPNRIAAIGTPAGSSHSGAIDGHCAAGVVKRALGCAAGVSESGVQSLPCQSIACAGGSPVRPSHQTSPSSVLAQLVKIELRLIVSIAFGFVRAPVPGATPKKPASGLTAYSWPSSPNFIQAMSSPIVSTFQSGSVGISIARLVLPHALGNAAGDVLDHALGRGQLEDQHVLGEPALVARHHRRDPQREALLAEQRVAAVARAERPDLARLGEVHDVLVVGVARPRHVLRARGSAASRPSAGRERSRRPRRARRAPADPSGS